MDSETREEFKNVKSEIRGLTSKVEEHLNYSRGLHLPERVTKSEDEIQLLKEKKASWYGLYLAVGLVLAIVSLAMAVISTIGE